MEIRNIAIIAHVDHGKTTLTDALMRQTGMVSEGITMDSNALEKERGITIYSKNTSIFFPPPHKASEGQVKTTKINIVDTPGHADFGSEVERVLRSIDSVILVVDAQEGPMPQTGFVLKKSLELGLKPIVVINKIDKPAARPKEVQEDVYELFLDLGANDSQLDFPVVFTNAKQGIAKKNLEDDSKDLTPLLETILEKVPPAPSRIDLPFKMQSFSLGYDNFLGRLAIGRVYEGIIKIGDAIIKKPTGEARPGKIIKIFTFHGLERKEVDGAIAGDIVMVAGLPDIYIGETICALPEQEPLPAISIDEPTITLNFLVNDSPFAGREGKFVTNKQLKERLEKELEINVGLKIDFSPPAGGTDLYKVCGRGELHIAILLENMRREGYELQVSQPQIIVKEENSQKLEPYEEVTIDVPENMAGSIIESLGRRRGLISNMKQENGQARLIFAIPTRGILGYRNQFLIETRGKGIFSSRVLGFKPLAGDIAKRETGSMISMANGKALAFALANLQERGTLYIGPTTEVYEGMVIGNVSKGNDLTVNPTKGKKLSNVRASGTDEAIYLTPPFIISIERGLEIMNDDEYLEITPSSVRLRKKYLTILERNRAQKKS